jgi:hypothetical protein
MYREEQREEAPDWLGPVVGLLVALMLIGLAVLLWLTVFAGGAHEEEEAAALTPPTVTRYVAPV